DTMIHYERRTQTVPFPTNIELDFRSGVPIYAQIVHMVETMVYQGELSPGDQLPTVRQLASDLRVNFNTVARAYRMLDEAHLISTQQGRGTYILERPTEEVRSQLRQEVLAGLTNRYLTEAERLGFTLDEVKNDIEHQSILWGKRPIENE
ncbi:MAG TPA: GntR family transcriptional regulator, partial [Longilinea sp.]|nr:GntR family transcriptional regulator [Longilinea sp.]